MTRLKKLYIGTTVAVGGQGVLVKFDDEGYAVDDKGERSDTFYTEEVLSPLSRFLDMRTVETTTTKVPTTTKATTTETPTTTEAPEETTTEAPTTTEATTTAAPKKKRTTTTTKE